MTADANRLAYLQAMEIDVWRERGAQEIGDSEPGSDQVLDGTADIPLLDWEQLQQHVAACKACGLHETRTQTVFGVGMKMSNEDDKDLDSTFQMGVVDFEGCKKRAYFPYEVLVDGKNVEALHMRFRMAMHFPNLSMMGGHGFTKLMSAPGVIEDALEEMVGAK